MCPNHSASVIVCVSSCGYQWKHLRIDAFKRSSIVHWHIHWKCQMYTSKLWLMALGPFATSWKRPSRLQAMQSTGAQRLSSGRERQNVAGRLLYQVKTTSGRSLNHQPSQYFTRIALPRGWSLDSLLPRWRWLRHHQLLTVSSSDQRWNWSPPPPRYENAFDFLGRQLRWKQTLCAKFAAFKHCCVPAFITKVKSR